MVAARIRAAAKREPLRKAHLTVLRIFLFFLCQDFYGKMSHLSARRIFLSFCANKTICEQHHISGAAAKRGHLRGANLTVLRIFLFFARTNIFDEKKSRRGSKKAKKLPNLLDSDIITFCFKNIDSNNVFNRFWIQIIEKAALVKTSGKHT